MTNIHGQFVSEENDFLFPEDCQSRCFICAKNLSLLNLKEEESYDREYSIRMVFRYLRINLYKQFSRTDNQLVDVVPFCELCYEVFRTLSNYCADLELLKMRIHYFLTKLNKLTVVEDVEQKCGFINKARQQLKRKLEEKCMPINQTGPFVILPQLDTGQTEKLKCQGTEGNFDCLSEVEYEPEKVGDNMVKMSESRYHSSDVDYESDVSRPTSNNLLRFGKSSTSSSTDNKDEAYRCLECNHEFKRKDSLQEHSPLCHPEKHFPPETKSDKLTPGQYKMYLIHLLNTEVDSCGSFKAGGYNCSYCPKSFKKKRRNALRLHLTKIHQAQLLGKIVQLQKDVSPEKMLKNFENLTMSQLNQNEIDTNFKPSQSCKIKNKIMKFEHICSICEVCTTKLRKHKAIHHPEQFLLSKRLENVSLDQFKMYCGYLMSKQVENFATCQEDGKVRFKCPHCPNTYIDSFNCRNHLILGHVNLLSVEIEKLQKTMRPEELKRIKALEIKEKAVKNSEVATVKCEICDVCLTQRSMAIHMRKIHPDEHLKSSSSEVCSICKQKFMYKWTFEFHKTGCHAHIIFEKWKGEMTTVEQFKSYCRYMIEKEVSALGQVGSTDGRRRFKCSYCTSTFSDTKSAQIHLVRDHKEIIGSKLEDLLKSKTVEEVEQGVVIKREKSQEKFAEEEEEDFEATEVFCEKRAVKQEASEIWTGNDNDGDEMMDLEDLNERSSEIMDNEIINDDCKMDVEAVLPD